MIVDWIVKGLLALVSDIVGLLPQPSDDMKAAVAGFPSQVQDLIDSSAKFAPLVPFQQMNAALLIVLTAFPIYFAYLGAVKAISLLTGGGGSK